MQIIFRAFRIFFLPGKGREAGKGTDGEVESGEWRVESGEMPDVALVEVDWG